MTSQASAAKITQSGLDAWNESVIRVEALTRNSVCDPEHFLWLDSRQKIKSQVQAGKVLAQRAEDDDMLAVPSGLIHHWRGEAFVPGAEAPDLLRSLVDYNAYAEAYSPAVVDSKLVRHERNEYTYRLRFQQRGFGITIGLLGDFRSQYFSVDSRTGYMFTSATKLVELEDAGTPDERALSLEEAHGYLEKLFTIVRYRQSDGGVYVEVESLTLSRDVPGAVRWVVAPLIQRFSRQVMNSTLTKLRDSVKQNDLPETIARR